MYIIYIYSHYISLKPIYIYMYIYIYVLLQTTCFYLQSQALLSPIWSCPLPPCQEEVPWLAVQVWCLGTSAIQCGVGKWGCTLSNYIRIGSMYGIYANIGGILMVNVTIYTKHGSYEIIWIVVKTPSPKSTVCTQKKRKHMLRKHLETMYGTMIRLSHGLGVPFQTNLHGTFQKLEMVAIFWGKFHQLYGRPNLGGVHFYPWLGCSCQEEPVTAWVENK